MTFKATSGVFVSLRCAVLSAESRSWQQRRGHGRVCSPFSNRPILDGPQRIPTPPSIRAFHSSDSGGFRKDGPRHDAARPERSEAKADGSGGRKGAPSRSSPSTLAFLVESVRTFLAPRSAAAHKRLDMLGSRWNELSGYDEVQRLKREVSEMERNISSLRAAQAAARAQYLQSVTQRSNSQAAITDLLTRKASWSDADLSKYTSLLRSEHAEARAAKEAEEGYERAEKETVKGWDDLMKRVLERYHEEQVWSDKIRTASTWGSFVVVGLNVLIFLLAIIIVEPYKRRALLRAAEARILAGEDKSRQVIEHGLQTLSERFSAVEQRLEELGGADKAGSSAGGTASESQLSPAASSLSALAHVQHAGQHLIGMLATAARTIVATLSPIPPPALVEQTAATADTSSQQLSSFGTPDAIHTSANVEDASVKRRRDKHTRDVVVVSAITAIAFAGLLRAMTDQ